MFELPNFGVLPVKEISGDFSSGFSGNFSSIFLLNQAPDSNPLANPSRVRDAVSHVDPHADRVLAQLHKVEDDAALPAHVRTVAELELQVLK